MFVEFLSQFSDGENVDVAVNVGRILLFMVHPKNDQHVLLDFGRDDSLYICERYEDVKNKLSVKSFVKLGPALVEQ